MGSRHWSFRSRTRSSTLFCLPRHRLVPRDAPSLAQGACDDGAFTIPTRTCCELVVQFEISDLKSCLVTIVFFFFSTFQQGIVACQANRSSILTGIRTAK